MELTHRPQVTGTPTAAESHHHDKCFEIDKKIEHYRRLTSQVMDDLMSEGIGKLVAELTLEKLGLHPPDEPGS